jgi:hypothetical protein
MPVTTAQRRAHYDDFVRQVITLCAVNGIRADLNSGFGRPVAECSRMPEHLTRHIAGFGAREPGRTGGSATGSGLGTSRTSRVAAVPGGHG